MLPADAWYVLALGSVAVTTYLTEESPYRGLTSLAQTGIIASMLGFMDQLSRTFPPSRLEDMLSMPLPLIAAQALTLSSLPMLTATIMRTIEDRLIYAALPDEYWDKPLK